MVAGGRPHRRPWLAATPALVALIGGAVLIGWLMTRSPADRSGWYAAAAADAFDAHDYRTAAVCYARVMQGSPRVDASTVLNLADRLSRTGQPDAARGLLLRLAPPGHDGLAAAHLRLVKLDLSFDRPASAEVDDAECHLELVRRQRPDDPEVAYWTAVIAAARGHWDDAAVVAAHTGPLRPVLAERLAKMAAAAGNAGQAAAWSHDRPIPR